MAKTKQRCYAFGLMTLALFCLTACTEKKSELDNSIEAMAAKQGITDKKLLEEIKQYVGPILATKERFIYKSIRIPCAEDMERLCEDASGPSSKVQCIQDHREQVTNRCEEALAMEVGSLPLKKDQYYHGVLLPKGSTFFGQNMHGYLGAIVSEDFEYNGLRFKKGQIRFHKTGLSVGELADDQYIDGVKYKVSRMAIFFHEDGTVENAVLAKDTEFGGILFKGGKQIKFYSSGQVQHGTVARGIIVQGNTCRAGEQIWFKEDGSFISY